MSGALAQMAARDHGLARPTDVDSTKASLERLRSKGLVSLFLVFNHRDGHEGCVYQITEQGREEAKRS